MADAAEQKEYSMTEVATHTIKESTWLVIKDMNDGGERVWARFLWGRLEDCHVIYSWEGDREKVWQAFRKVE